MPSSDHYLNMTISFNITACLANCTEICLSFPCLPSPPPESDNPDSIPIRIHHKKRILNYSLIAAASLIVLSSLSLLILYFFIIRRRRNSPPPPPPPIPAVDPFLDDDDTPQPHHVWFIRTVGLDESIIKSIASYVYKAGDGFLNVTDCSVCLGEFADGEDIKLLPKCSHAFHVPCIDTWLASHVNCPLCRAPVVAPKIEIEPSTSSSATAEVAVVVDENCNESEGSGSGLPEDFELQPVRRSVSMDCLSVGALLHGMEKEVGLEVVRGDNMGKERNLSKVRRSLSSRSGRLFFPRHGRGPRCSILPL